MINTEALAPTTSAAQSSQFDASPQGPVSVILYAASGLTSGEYANLQISHDGGTTWQDVYDSVGDKIRLHSLRSSLVVNGPGTFRVYKEASTNAAGVYISYESY